jgi:C-terminal peptidase prc
MYSTLSDNFTNYYSPYIADRLLNMITYSETAVGIGAEVKLDSASVLVFTQVYNGGPADAAGIKKGDVVISVNGTVPNTTDAFDKLTTGKEGEKITLEISRNGDTCEIVVTLAPYISPTVFVDEYDNIPVITITEFTDTTSLPTGTYGEFLEALKQTEGATSTIIDLRGNPGGSVDHCLNIASELVSKNDTLTTIIEHSVDTITYEPRVDTVTYTAESDGLGKGRYYVFLADTGSASCSEIMLNGVLHNTKSPLVGMVTYGKGIGQAYLVTYAGGLAGITCLRFFDKYGNTYHRYGFAPDFEESDPDKALDLAISIAKEATAVGAGNYGTTDLGHFTLKKSARGSKKPERGGAYKVIPRPIVKPAPLK